MIGSSSSAGDPVRPVVVVEGHVPRGRRSRMSVPSGTAGAVVLGPRSRLMAALKAYVPAGRENVPFQIWSSASRASCAWSHAGTPSSPPGAPHLASCGCPARDTAAGWVTGPPPPGDRRRGGVADRAVGRVAADVAGGGRGARPGTRRACPWRARRRRGRRGTARCRRCRAPSTSVAADRAPGEGHLVEPAGANGDADLGPAADDAAVGGAVSTVGAGAARSASALSARQTTTRSGGTVTVTLPSRRLAVVRAVAAA